MRGKSESVFLMVVGSLLVLCVGCTILPELGDPKSVGFASVDVMMMKKKNQLVGLGDVVWITDGTQVIWARRTGAGIVFHHLKPGKYRISKVSFQSYITVLDIDQLKNAPILEFEVEAGKYHYLGCLKIYLIDKPPTLIDSHMKIDLRNEAYRLNQFANAAKRQNIEWYNAISDRQKQVGKEPRFFSFPCDIWGED